MVLRNMSFWPRIDNFAERLGGFNWSSSSTTLLPPSLISVWSDGPPTFAP